MRMDRHSRVEDGLMLTGIEKVDQQSVHSMFRKCSAGAGSRGGLRLSRLRVIGP